MTAAVGSAPGLLDLSDGNCHDVAHGRSARPESASVLVVQPEPAHGRILTSGLNLGTPYTRKGHPAGGNPATGLPWAPATDGLRNITGRVNRSGTVTIWAITSTVSGSGDQGSDPNKLVAITDQLSATAPGAREQFWTVKPAGFGQVLRGVSFTPGTDREDNGR